jgi:protoheme IX farnesyltransferase
MRWGKELYAVFKLRIGIAIAVSALAGLAVTPGPAPTPWQVVAVALAVLLSATSAGALNHYIERDLDALMPRTRGRPFVTGVFRAGPLWLTVIFLMLLVAVAVAGLAVNVWVAVYTFLGAFVYGVVYSVWLKRRTWLNIVLGGLSGSFAVLAGAAAVDPTIPAAPMLLAVVLFLWTPPHFWSLAMRLNEEYARARVPMLPVVIGSAYLAAAAAGGGYFVYRSVQLVRRPGPEAAARNFHASLVQLGLLLIGALASTGGL